jgi:hypothetical protein
LVLVSPEDDARAVRQGAFSMKLGPSAREEDTEERGSLEVKNLGGIGGVVPKFFHQGVAKPALVRALLDAGPGIVSKANRDVRRGIRGVGRRREQAKERHEQR